MNTIDSLIIKELQRNARQSNRKLAAKLAVSPTTISNRLRKLVDTNSIDICCVSNPLLLGFSDLTLIGLKVAPGKEKKVAKVLQNQSNVQNVALVAGRYNLLAYAIFPDNRSHLRWITNELGSIREVLEYEEIRILQFMKDNLEYTNSESIIARDTKPKRLDKHEMKLIQALEINPRESIGSLAKKAGLSRQASASKLQQLLDENVIRIVGIPNPSTTGSSGYASIFLTLQLPRIADVADILAKNERTTYVSILSGQYNILAMVSFESLDDLSHFLLNDIGELPGIINRETMINIGRQRRSFGLARILMGNLILKE